MTVHPDGPPDVRWMLQSRRPADLGWCDDTDHYRLDEARADVAQRLARKTGVDYRLIESTTTYRVVTHTEGPTP